MTARSGPARLGVHGDVDVLLMEGKKYRGEGRERAPAQSPQVWLLPVFDVWILLHSQELTGTPVLSFWLHWLAVKMLPVACWLYWVWDSVVILPLAYWLHWLAMGMLPVAC
ncbi:palmitoyltransferase ZDHHC5 [Platysternon megacephalum]|uniref:Palmitoyltransferase ZDHHC5 n=1 Tax=Platysternon megacephalum TaxID=55544 RepID=A0A4D9DZ16_9SAUR|nr:palmitoyltransferase ZDHHC5 [Platysternon megacephalum]